MAHIYKITNAVDGKVYVGKTNRTISKRFKLHISKHNTGTTYLYRAMRLHGLANFSISEIEEVCEVDASTREQFWIVKLGTKVPLGYNMTNGGDGGDTSDSPQFQKYLANRDYRGVKNPMYGKRGKENPNYGSCRSDEQKINMSVGLTTAWEANADRKDKQSNKMQGVGNPMFGKKPKNTKRVVFDGVLYDSIADCMKATKRSSYYIQRHGHIQHDITTQALAGEI